ncbi:MAG: two-component sensor histidine kinase [Patiriisocius sp.]|jgi:two-component sensor histidine kinase
MCIRRLLSKYIKRVVNPLTKGQDIQLKFVCDEIKENIDFLIPIGLIITECVNNSIKHAFTNGTKHKKIEFLIKKNRDGIKITYTDNGSGYSPVIVDSIIDLDSFGLILINSLAQQINSEIKFTNDNGAKMTLKIPAD